MHEFLCWFYFLTIMDYGLKGKFGHHFLKQARKGQNFLNWRGHAQWNWFVCNLHQPLSTCINFLSRFYFLTPIIVQRKNLAILKQMRKGLNFQNQRGHTHQNWFACILHQPLLAWIFWVNHIFWPPWTLVQGPMGKFGHFEDKRKRSKISKTIMATPTKIGAHAFYINLYLHECFEPILFFDPVDYIPYSRKLSKPITFALFTIFWDLRK